MIKQEDYPFILYNNRSIEGVVSNFIDWKDYDAKKIVSIEKVLDALQTRFNQGKEIGIEKSELNLEAKDITYGIDDLKRLTSQMNDAKLLDSDREWLNNRGIDDDLIEIMNLKSLSHFTDEKDLELLGCTVHPLLDKMLEDGIEEGGIIIPLYKEGKLVNCTIRKLSDIGKLKYTQACPEVDVWGLDTIIEGREAWITEGIFDAGALYQQGAPSASVSSAMWSSLQLYQLMEKNPREIFIFADNDQTGLRCARILQLLFITFGFPASTFVSKKAKDPAEHFLEKKLGWEDIEKIEITTDMILSKEDQTFNFTKYLKTREF
jgi:hypothetical protein